MENKNLDLQKTLEFVGFSNKEVLVYLALLQLGKGTVTQISKKAGINRPTGVSCLVFFGISRACEGLWQGAETRIYSRVARSDRKNAF